MAEAERRLDWRGGVHIVELRVEALGTTSVREGAWLRQYEAGCVRCMIEAVWRLGV